VDENFYEDFSEQAETSQTTVSLTVQPDYTEQLELINTKFDCLLALIIVMIGFWFTGYIINKIIFAKC